jgi:S-formylglutathione hydrolase
LTDFSRTTCIKRQGMNTMMKNLLLLCLAAFIAVGVSTSCGSNESKIFEKSIPAPSLRGNLVGEPVEQSIAVYLPPGYASDGARYPVVYLLPGYDTGADAFLDGTFQGFALPVVMDSLIAQGAIEKMIVVVVNGRSVLGGSFFVNSPVTGNWENFLVRDVVRYVDEEYKTLPFRETRGIAGHSTGGTAALQIGLNHPDVFSAVYSLSPGFFDGGGEVVRRWFEDDRTAASLVAERDQMADAPREEAHAAFIHVVNGLMQSSDQRDRNRAFLYAYGAAFVPHTDLHPPYAQFPFADDADSLDSEILQKWEHGFGGIEERIDSYQQSDAKLDSVVLDVGANDADRWILDGCEYVSARLNDAGIPRDLRMHEGGHEDRLRERMEAHMLPFFSRELAPE